MSYKYPLIPKEYYAPVMYACSLIRKHGTFNRAVNAAAKYYGVEPDEIAYHVRARQAAGQKGKTRKYNTYYVFYINDYGTIGDYYVRKADEIRTLIDLYDEIRIKKVKATSAENASINVEKNNVWHDDGRFNANIVLLVKNDNDISDDEAEKGFYFQYGRHLS